MRSLVPAALATFALAIPALSGCAEVPAPEVLLTRSPDSSPHNWGALPTLLGTHAHLEVRADGALPTGDLSRFKLIIISTNLNAFMPQRERLWEYVRGGGKLVTWFPDDRRTDPQFFPYKLILSDDDPPAVTFRDEDHPLLEGLRGRTFKGRQYGGDVVSECDRERWRVLADSPRGPVMLICGYGAGAILDVQFHAPLSRRADVLGPLADNLISWAGVQRLSPDYLASRSIREVVLAVARRQVHPLTEGDWSRGAWGQVRAARSPAGVRWGYPWGVTLYGLLRVAEVTGEEGIAQFVLRHNEIAARHYDYLRWHKRVFGKSGKPAGLSALVRLSCLDDCGSMGSQVIEGLLNHGAEAAPETREMLQIIADYITHRQSRLPDGSLCRGRTLWIDDLYMSVPFLARWGTYTQQAGYWDDAARQVITFASRMQDEDGLWFHGYYERKNQPSPYKWGRGNGWAMLATVAALDQLPEDHAERPRLLAILRRHIEGLKRVQAPSGLWRQVLDHEDFWEETSCSGMFAFSIARACNRNWIDRGDLSVARRAFEALKGRVAWDGVVLGTCAGTGVSRSLEYYRKRPQPINDGHGPGPVMLAGAELLAASSE